MTAKDLPPVAPGHGPSDRQSALVRAKAGIHDWIGRAGRGLLHATPTAIVTGMTAAALAPLLLPLLGGVTGAGAMGQILAQLGNVGADYISQMAQDTVARLRAEAAVTIVSEETVRNVLERRLETELASPHAAALRAQMAGLLAAVNGVGTTLDAAFRSEVEGLAAHIGQAVRDISETVSEFAGLRAEVLESLADIQGNITQTLALQEDTLALQRDASRKLEVVSTEIALLRRALASGRPASMSQQTSGASEPGGPGLEGGELADVYPYPGLEPFRETDAFWFHGRDRLTVALIKRLRGLLRGPSPLMVVGASGAGKSSLLHAGLLYELGKGDLLAGSQDWPHITMTPGSAPLRELAIWLGIRAELPTTMVHSEIEADPSRTPLIARQALLTREERRRRGVRAVRLKLGAGGDKTEPGGVRRLVVVIDQFEEVFTCLPQERVQFIEAVCALAAGSVADPPPALVVIGLRAGFVEDCTAHPPLEPALREQFIVGPMSTAELHAAIEQPASDAGLTVEPGLAEAMLSDLGAVNSPVNPEWPTYDPGALPLLAHALRETWERRDHGRMTVAAYHEAGGIKQAIAQKAEKVYHRLDEAGRQVARELLAQMVSVRSDAEDTRRRMSREALLAQLPRADAETAGQVLDLLEQERLVTADGESVQIAHEALLRHWPRLTTWLDEDRSWHRVRQRLTEQTQEWEEGNRHSDRLLRGAQLSAVTAQLTSARRAGLGALETAFLRASQRRETRSYHARMAFMSVLTVAVLVAAGFAVVAQRNSEAAQKQRAIAESRQLAARAQTLAGSAPAASLELSLEAYRIQHTAEAVSSLLTAQSSYFTDRLVSPAGAVNAVAYDPTSPGMLASAAADDAVTLWHPPIRTAVAMLRGRSPFYDVAFDPAGHLLAGAEANGATVLWDPRSRREIGTVTAGDGASIDAVAFSPDGRFVATAGWDGNVTLWWTRTLAKARTFEVGGGAIWGIAFSPDGSRLAAACSDHDVRVWQLAQPTKPPLTLTGHTAPVRAVAFSPDSRLLASASDDGTVRLWNPRTGRLLSVLASGSARVRSVAFSPDGTELASGADFPDDSVRVWDVGTGTQIAALTGPANAVAGVTFSPDSRTIAGADTDATVGLWQIAGPPPDSGMIASVAVAPQRGGPIATAAAGQWADIWYPRQPGRHVVIHGLPPGPDAAPAASGPGTRSIALSPGGTMLAVPSARGVTMWNVTARREVRILHTPLAVDSVAFQPAPRLGAPPAIAAGSTNDEIYLWAGADSRRLAFSGQQQGPINVVVFSPDGRYLAAGGSDGTIVIARLGFAHGTPSATVIQQASGVGPVRALAYSPDGRTLASAAGHTVLLWQVGAGDHLSGPAALTGPAQAVLSMSFSPDGSLLAASAADHTINIWNVAQPGSPSSSATLSGLSTATGVAFVPGAHTLAAAAWDGTAQLWNINPDQVAQQICAFHPAVAPATLATYMLGVPYQPLCPATG